MTIEKFLEGFFNFKFSKENYDSVLASRDVEPDTHFNDVSEKDKDLMKADLYMILASVASGGGRKVQMGSRSVAESTFTFGATDRAYFRRQANDLYSKWGEEKKGRNVKFVRFYGK